jgi:multidrug efflux pump subunit AcrA (membrane-fusion protein)
MNASLILLTSLALAGPPARPVAALKPSALPRATVISHALVSVIDDVQVPAQESGLLVAVNAEEGTLVKKDQLVAQLDDRQAKLERHAANVEREAALAKAEDDIEVRFSQASLEVAAAEVATNEAMLAKTPGVVPAGEMRKIRLAKKRAELAVDKSKLDLSVAQMNAQVYEAKVKVTDHTIERRRIVSPMDGEVVARLKQRGEWVNAGEPVLRVIRMDRLKVEGLLPAADFNPAELMNQPVLIEVELAHGQKGQFQGEVTYISPLVTAGNKYRVRCEVVNRAEKQQWLLRPGMSAVVHIGLE